MRLLLPFASFIIRQVEQHKQTVLSNWPITPASEVYGYSCKLNFTILTSSHSNVFFNRSNFFPFQINGQALCLYDCSASSAIIRGNVDCVLFLGPQHARIASLISSSTTTFGLERLVTFISIIYSLTFHPYLFNFTVTLFPYSI